MSQSTKDCSKPEQFGLLFLPLLKSMKFNELTEEEIEDALSDAGVRIGFDYKGTSWRYETCFDTRYLPRVVGEWTTYEQAVKEGLAFAEGF